jgi:large conductance mechanosensitive channel
VIGRAFGKVVDAEASLVMGNILNPALKAANLDSIQAWPARSVIVALINILVSAFVMFLIICAIEAMRHSEEAVAAPDPQAQLASAAKPLADALERRQP